MKLWGGFEDFRISSRLIMISYSSVNGYFPYHISHIDHFYRFLKMTFSKNFFSKTIIKEYTEQSGLEVAFKCSNGTGKVLKLATQ